MKFVTLREYATVFKGKRDASSLDAAYLPDAAWQGLMDLARDRGKQSALCRPIFAHGQMALRLQNFVGVVELPGNIYLEILPKVADESHSPETLRELLIRMLCDIGELPKFIRHDRASIDIAKRPLLEVFFKLFLEEVSKLVRTGLRSDYVIRDETLAFLKGKWRVKEQMKVPVTRSHLFEVSHDEYLMDRAENRLIHSSLLEVSKRLKSSELQRLSRELRFVFQEIPKSNNYRRDFQLWRTDRNMIHYRDLLPWCRLILNDLTPLIYRGAYQGISLLFPMEVVFERYVATCLKRQILSPFALRTQVASKSLVVHNPLGSDRTERWFRLKPDLLIQNAGGRTEAVLDTKWKIINAGKSSSKEKYGMSQNDMYQMFGYAHKYLGGKGNLYLIYPVNHQFRESLPCFEFSNELRLWAIPFDLQKKKLISPPDGLRDLLLGNQSSQPVTASPTQP